VFIFAEREFCRKRSPFTPVPRQFMSLPDQFSKMNSQFYSDHHWFSSDPRQFSSGPELIHRKVKQFSFELN